MRVCSMTSGMHSGVSTSARAVAGRTGQYVVLQAELDGSLENVGVVLVDPESDRAWIRIRRDLDRVPGPTDREWLELLQSDLETKASESGGTLLLDWIGSTLSNFLRTSDLETVLVDRFESTLYRLYRRHIPAETRAFVTHLPRFSLQAAAGYFGGESEPGMDPDDWEEAPEGLRLNQGMFVAQVVGRSMEPRIPDGSLAVFRTPVGGSRSGRILLVENYSDVHGVGRYTVKRYTSSKKQTPTGEWAHEWIRLEPLNPDFEAWDLPADQVKVIAEFVCVLDS